MVKVRYVGSRACKADGVLWGKYDVKDVPDSFYERFKNQGFELVKDEKKKKKPIEKVEEKEEKVVEEKKNVFINDDDTKDETIEENN